MSQLDEPDKQAVDYILKGCKILLALIDEVLDLARVEAGELGRVHDTFAVRKEEVQREGWMMNGWCI